MASTNAVLAALGPTSQPGTDSIATTRSRLTPSAEVD